jgi:very-short-patch-repair endonuclease
MAPKSLERSCYIYKDIWSSRNELLPEQVCISSGIKFWFDCHKCGHEYQQKPDGKTKGRRCPFCSNRKLCEDINCLSCLSRSCYVYKDIWSSRNCTESHKIFISSNTKYWFDCLNCGHDYEQVPTSKSAGKGCPYCSNKSRCGNLNCDFCLTNSCYIYRDIWSKKNDKQSKEVAISSGIKYWFKCNICNHEYNQSPDKKRFGRGCSFCSNQKLCGDISCSYCLAKSCYKYKEIWSIKNCKNPKEVFISSGIKYFFDCLDCGNEYIQQLDSKTRGSGCTFCINKTERKLADYLKENKIEFKKEFKINSKKRYDFFIQKFNLIIEIDGDQHFQQVSNWGNFEDTIENDIQKMKVALENGYSILRIYQPDIWLDKIDWKRCINDNLYIRKTPEITCRSSIPGIYNRHE